MPAIRQPVLHDNLDAALLAMFDVAQQGGDEDGMLSDDAQEKLQRIAALFGKGKQQEKSARPRPPSRFFAAKSLRALVQKEAQHAPKGGVFLTTMKGETRWYKGGQWIPASEIANLPAAEKLKLERAKQQSRMQRVQRGDIDAGKLRAQLQPHAAPLDQEQRQRAISELRALHGYHGALTLHRIEQLAQQQQGFLKRANLTDKQKKQIRGNLARLRAMIDLAGAAGVTGKVPEALKKQARMGKSAPETVRPKPADYRTAPSKEPALEQPKPLEEYDSSESKEKPKSEEQPPTRLETLQALRDKAQQHAAGGGRFAVEQRGLGFGVPVTLDSAGTGFKDSDGRIWPLRLFVDDPNNFRLRFEAPAEKKTQEQLPDEKGTLFDRSAQDEPAPKNGAESTEPPRREVDAALTSVEGKWDRAVQRDPEVRQLIESKNRKKQVRGLLRLMRQGLTVPDAIKESRADAFRAAERKLSQDQYRSDLIRNKQQEHDYWTDKAFEAGIRPKDLHDLARENLREDEKRRTFWKKFRARALELFAHYGYDARTLTANLRKGTVEDNVPAVDVVTRALSSEFPGVFGGSIYDRGADEYDDRDDTLLDLMAKGVPPPMSREEAYEEAFKQIQTQMPSQREREPGDDDEEIDSDSDWVEDPDEPFPFGANARKALRAWLRKAWRRGDGTQQFSPKQREKSWTTEQAEKHPRAPKGSGHGGEFTSGHQDSAIRPDVAGSSSIGNAPIVGEPTSEQCAAAQRWAADSPGLSPEQAAQYAEHLSHALSVLPAGISRDANESLSHGGVKFHADLKTLRAEAKRINGKSAADVVGFAHDRGMATDLHLDGGDDPRGTYVHELWHAADNGSFHSDDKGWQSAYKKDILKGKNLLSRYALVNPSEGFAEFGRILAIHGVDYMAQRWPNAVKHLKSKGLI